MSKDEAPLLFRFGDFTVHRRERTLRRDGVRLKLHGQPFEILLLLVEHPGEVVTREELQAKLWHGDTFVDFENGLNVAVKKLRQTLGDSATTPRYIETLPKVGYRFLMPVTTADPTGSQVISPAAPQKSPTESPIYRPVRPRTRFWRWLVLATALILLIVLGVFWNRKRQATIALTEGDLVLVADFVNTTGDPVFDGTLKQALTVKLGESPYFNIVLDGVTRQTLRLMGRPPDEHVVPPIAREVCEREGAKVAVGGSIVTVGDKYVLDLNATNCLTGATVVHEQFAAQNKDEIVSKVGQIIPPLRRMLGESIASIEKFDTPIEQATTPSLAALKAYTEGDEKRAHGEEAESIPFYKMAIELDSNFAIPYARLGAIYGDLGERALAEQYMKQAFERREHVSAREKFYISAHYYADSTGETDKTISTYQLWTQIYSHDWVPFNNLANEYYRIGQSEKAIEAAREALRLNPKHPLTYGGLVNAFRQNGQYAEAKAISEKAIAAKLDNFIVHWNLYFIAFDEGDQAAMQREVEWFKGKPVEHEFLNFRAWTAMSAGQVQEGRKLFDRARALALENGAKENSVIDDTDQAQLEAELGNLSEARAKADRAARLMPESQLGLGAVAFACARVGESTRAEMMANNLAQRYPLNSQLNFVILPAIRAALDLGRSPATVIEDLQPAVPYDFSSTSNTPDGITTYYRGLAYLQQRSGKEAAAQFQSMVDHRGVFAFSPLWPLAHLGLARSYALMGSTDTSLAEYRQFFALWKGADQDVPILREAKVEYERLQR